MLAYRTTCEHDYCTTCPSQRNRNCNPASLLKSVASTPHREKLGLHTLNTSVGSGHHPVTLTYTTQSMLVGARQAQPRTTHKTASSHPKSLTAHLNLMFSHVAPQPLNTRRNVWRGLRSTWLSSAKHKLKDRTARWNTLDISNNPADLTAMHKNNDSATQNRTLRAESNGA